METYQVFPESADAPECVPQIQLKLAKKGDRPVLFPAKGKGPAGPISALCSSDLHMHEDHISPAAIRRGHWFFS